MGTCVKTLSLGYWDGQSSKLRSEAMCESCRRGVPRKLYLGLNQPVIFHGADRHFSFAIQSQRLAQSRCFGRDTRLWSA
jgi:hypothetical protein